MSAVIQVRDLRKVYPDTLGPPALDGVSLEIRRGEVTMLMGPSGSGKTTLISIMGGILRPTSGSIRIDGQEIAHLGERDLPAIRLRHVGFVFQSFNLFPTMSASDNVEIALNLKGVHGDAARQAARALLDEVGLSDKYDAHPADLSGGEKQRVAIARALAGNPDIILADEPTAALDSVSGRVVMEKLCDLARRGRAVLIVTHDTRILPYANRIIEIEDGRILTESGSHESIYPMEEQRRPRRPIPGIDDAVDDTDSDVPTRTILDTTAAPSRRGLPIGMLILVAVAVVASAWLALRAMRAPDVPGAPGTAAADVETPGPTASAAVTGASGANVVSGVGQVEPASEALRIGFPGPGRLRDVPVEEGQTVKAGQVIAVLESADLNARVEQAQAQVRLRQAELDRLVNGSDVHDQQRATAAVAEARALLEQAQADVEQRRGLVQTGDMARSALERAERDVQLARARLDKAEADLASVKSPARGDDLARVRASLQSAEAQLSEARALLTTSVIRAPFDGVVLRRYHRGGELVAGSGDPVVSFGDVSRLVVRVDVDESDVGRIRVGDRATFTAQAYGSRRFTGKVARIGGQLGRKNIDSGDPGAKIDTRVLETLVELDGTPEIPIGLRVDAFIEVQQPRTPAAPR